MIVYYFKHLYLTPMFIVTNFLQNKPHAALFMAYTIYWWKKIPPPPTSSPRLYRLGPVAGALPQGLYKWECLHQFTYRSTDTVHPKTISLSFLTEFANEQCTVIHLFYKYNISSFNLWMCLGSTHVHFFIDLYSEFLLIFKVLKTMTGFLFLLSNESNNHSL